MSIENLEFIVQKMSAGSVSAGDWETLVHFCTGKDLVVELGTNIGSTAILLSHCAKEVVTVDVFEDLDLIYDEEFRKKYKSHFDVNGHYFKTIKEKLSARPNIAVFQRLSHIHAVLHKNKSVDVVFVDADHSRRGVELDHEAWLPKVKIGGFMIFHDVGEGCPGVWNFYHEKLLHDDRIELVEYPTVGPCWTKAFRKK